MIMRRSALLALLAAAAVVLAAERGKGGEGDGAADGE